MICATFDDHRWCSGLGAADQTMFCGLCGACVLTEKLLELQAGVQGSGVQLNRIASALELLALSTAAPSRTMDALDSIGYEKRADIERRIMELLLELPGAR